MRRPVRAGYTLMEVFLCIIVVSGVFFALATVFPTSLSCVRKSQTTIIAQSLAQQYIELYKQMDFSTVLGPMVGSPVLTNYPNPPSVPDPPGWDGTTYTIVVTVSQGSIILDGTTIPNQANVLQLDVQVFWNAGSMTGNQMTTEVNGSALPVFAESSVHDSTAVFKVANPW